MGAKQQPSYKAARMRPAKQEPAPSPRSRPIPLRRPKQVHFCTGVSADLDLVTCLIYLLFGEGKFKQSAFWSNYPQKCIFLAQKSICWIRQITYILLVEARNLGYCELGTLLFYFDTSERFGVMFFLSFSCSLTEECW